MTYEEYNEEIKKNPYVTAGSPLHEVMHRAAQEAMMITAELNGSYHLKAQVRELLEKLWNIELDEIVGMFPPFYTDYGKNTRVGKNVFINAGCKFQDQGGITVKDGALIGHNAVLATINHDSDPAKRGNMIILPITIGKNAWIGANATILAGVSVGDGAIVAAGAVATKDVPDNTVVGGVPAKVIRKIGETV